MKKINSTVVLIYLYLFCGLVGYLGAADKAHTQIVYLGFLNLISIYYIYNKEEKIFKIFGDQIKKLPVFIFFIFFCWSLLAMIPALNIQESLIQNANYFIQLISFIVLLYLFSKVKNLNIIVKSLIIGLTIVEVFSSIFPFIDDIIKLGQPIPRGLKYRGMTGSVNILAFSLLIKLPFMLYYSLTSNKSIIYIALSTIMIFVIIHITKSRAAIYSLFLILFVFTAFYSIFIYRSRELKFSKYLKTLSIILLPIVIVLVTDLYLSNKFKSELTLMSRITSINDQDFSTNSRYRYYTHALETILEKPFLGIGTGNWKIFSVKKDSKNMDGYIVPYHVHNDFLEISAESGLLGGLLYFSMILYVLFLLTRKILIKIKINKNFMFEVLLLLGISAYVLDGLFNFPAARPIQQINLIFLLVIAIHNLSSEIKEINLKPNKLIVIFLLTLIPFSIYSTLRVYKSSKEQQKLLAFFNYQRMDAVEGEIDSYEMNYPNITVTSLPLKAVKGVYYFKNEQYEKAIDLFNEGRKHSPYLYLTETYKGMAYLYLEEKDSARILTRQAYKAVPGNMLHLSHYFNVLATLKDSVAIKSEYESIKNKDARHDEIYVVSMSSVIKKDYSDFAELEKFNISAQSAYSDLSVKGYYQLKIGYDDMMRAATLQLLGEYAFEAKNFNEALNNFSEAAKLNPYEIPYQENAANALLQLNRNEEVITLIDNIIDKNLTPKLKYTRALAYLSLDNIETACLDLKQVYLEGFIPQNIYDNFCINIDEL